MANLPKGIMDLPFRGGTVHLQMTINAICELESVQSAEEGRTVGIDEIMGRFSNAERAKAVTVIMLRRIIWAMMIEHQPESTERDAGDLIMQSGGIGAITHVLKQGIKAAFPDAAPPPAKGPRRAGKPKATAA